MWEIWMPNLSLIVRWWTFQVKLTGFILSLNPNYLVQMWKRFWNAWVTGCTGGDRIKLQVFHWQQNLFEPGFILYNPYPTLSFPELVFHLHFSVMLLILIGSTFFLVFFYISQVIASEPILSVKFICCAN